jgi:ankyrin repeat protein
MAELLLEKGANPNIQNIYGETPLHQAVDNGKHNIINLLLEKYADPNLQQQVYISLMS